MLIQTSFLIRCWMEASEPAGAVRRFRVEHVQSGDCFDATLFSEIEAWMAETNRKHLQKSLSGAPNEEPSL